MKYLAFVLLAACGGGDDADTQGTASSCDLSADVGYCLDFAADAPAGAADGNCDSANSTLGYHGVANDSASCPTANRVGSCAAHPSGTAVTYRYYSPTWTSASAMTNCAGISGGGTFTAN